MWLDRFIFTPGAGATALPYAQRPQPGIAGTLFYAQEGGSFIDDGLAWRPLVGGMFWGTQPPAAATFTALNAGFSSLTDLSGALLLLGGASDAGATVMRGYHIASDGFNTDYVQATFEPANDLNSGASYPECGVFMLETSSGKMISLSLQLQSNGDSGRESQMTLYRWTNNTTRDVSTGYGAPPAGNGPLVLRLRRNPSGSMYTAEYSRDPNAPANAWGFVGNNAGAFTSAIDRVGVWCSNYNTPARATIRHFRSGH